MTPTAFSFENVLMAEGLDWIFRPVDRGWCKYESYVDGTLHIEDVALLCDALDVLEENRVRADEAAQLEAEKRASW